MTFFLLPFFISRSYDICWHHIVFLHFYIYSHFFHLHLFLCFDFKTSVDIIFFLHFYILWHFFSFIFFFIFRYFSLLIFCNIFRHVFVLLAFSSFSFFNIFYDLHCFIFNIFCHLFGLYFWHRSISPFSMTFFDVFRHLFYLRFDIFQHLFHLHFWHLSIFSFTAFVGFYNLYRTLRRRTCGHTFLEKVDNNMVKFVKHVEINWQIALLLFMLAPAGCVPLNNIYRWTCNFKNKYMFHELISSKHHQKITGFY